MKKTLILIFLIYGIFVYSNNMYVSYTNKGEIKLDYNYNFEATNLYVANIDFYIESSNESNNYIKVPGINEILNYLKFYQPGFSINYRYKNSIFNDPDYFLWLKDSFILSFSNVFFNNPLSYSVSNGMIGINFKSKNSNYFYWINLYDFSETSLGYYYGNRLKFGFFSNTLSKKYDYGIFMVFGNNIITLSKEKFYAIFINKNIYAYLNFKNNENDIRNSFFYMKGNKFEINIPIINNDILFMINSNKSIGIKFNFKF